MLFLSLAIALASCTPKAREQIRQNSTVRTIRVFAIEWRNSSASWAKRAAPDPLAEPLALLQQIENPTVQRLQLAEIQQLIGAERVPEIPLDGWGRPLETWLYDRAGDRQVLIRSLGSDGKPENEDILKEWERIPDGFESEEAWRDIIYIDGNFVSWPQMPLR